MATPCVTCAQNSEIKGKPGIFPCLGCKQMFCMQHVPFHRQELATQLDFVISDRNELQEAIARQEDMVNVSLQLNIINEWEKKSVDQIHQVADNLRQQILSLAEEQKRIFKDQFNQLSQKLDSFREDENFYEQDIELLKEKCASLKCLLNLADIDIMVADISSFLKETVTVKKKEVVETKANEKLSFVEELLTRQKPYKQVRIPHDGSVYVLNDIALICSGNDFTWIDLQTNSLQSCRIEGISSPIICPSTYINGFLCTTSCSQSKIGLLQIQKENSYIIDGFSAVIQDIRCMVSFEDRMMLIHYGTEGCNCVQEWSLKDFRNGSKRALSPLCVWKPPLTCAWNETISSITFDKNQIALLITNNARKKPDNRIEIRTRNMNIIECLLLNAYEINSSSILCRLHNQYLLGDRAHYRWPCRFTLIDPQLVAREQKFLSKYGIKNIEIMTSTQNNSTLIIYRDDRYSKASTGNATRLFLDFYQI